MCCHAVGALVHHSIGWWNVEVDNDNYLGCTGFRVGEYLNPYITAGLMYVLPCTYSVFAVWVQSLCIHRALMVGMFVCMMVLHGAW